jgi:hypothetical protein
MIQKILSTTVATAALAFAAPTMAQQAHGGAGAHGNANAGAQMGGPSQSGLDARVNSQGSLNASPNGVLNSSPNSVLQTNPTTVAPTTTTGATNSQGLLHASPKAIAKANANSVLARGAVPTTALPGLTTGLTVNTSAGATLGTVSQVITGSDGSIRAVVVTSATGQTYTLSGNSLSISGDVVTTTSI